MGFFVYNFFYDCGVIEGSFARTKMSLSDFSLPIRSVAG